MELTLSPLKKKELDVTVPASKSLLSRALVLAAFTDGDTFLRAEGIFEDCKDMLRCLSTLGIAAELRADGILVHGRREFLRSASLDVGSAGTAARFLTAVLAFRGGEYHMRASPQMSARPMEFLETLEKAGVEFQPKESRRFPFFMHSDGIKEERMTVNTDVSTQYASGILLAAALGERPFTLHLTGSRTHGSYIALTVKLLKDFGADVVCNGDDIAVRPLLFVPDEYAVEPDLSGGCYFFALALLCRAKALVRGSSLRSAQGDMQFVRLLEARGLSLTQTPQGISADGTDVSSFAGFEGDFSDFSDQTLTAAALAPYAASPSRIYNVAHIRRQECDRLQAAKSNLTALGVPCSVSEDAISISPSPVKKGAVLDSFRDHRVAMAFALTGLKSGAVIKDPNCCKKTFQNYFEILKRYQ